MKKFAGIFILAALLSANVFAQDTLYFNQNYIPHTDTTLVFYPTGYNASQSYPLLFMLHGWSGNYAQWNSIVDLQSYADSLGFVIVCPDGFYDCWYINSPVDPNSQFEKFFFKNLVPAVMKKYSINKNEIFITGLSMGGHGAIYLFLKHPDFFRSAGSTSGILDITEFPDKWGLDKVLGKMKDEPNNWFDNSDLYLLKKHNEFTEPLIIDCGTGDFSLKVNEKFVQICRQYNLFVTFNSGPGKHSRTYWKSSIPSHFRFFKNLVLADRLKK